MNSNDDKNRYSTTLNLLKTDFPLRADAALKEKELLARWKEHNLYRELSEKRAGDENSFILHAGPPYANGHIHMGTAANNILKDIICKSQRMMNNYVPFKIGWDCHGLPIERNVEKEFSSDDTIAFKKACRDYAQKWINTQREEFKSLGVLADYDRYYATMSPRYEGLTIQAFGEFYRKGYIERKNKTVPWCATCKTVLAMAEIEYKERKDPSCYIFFPLVHSTNNAQLFSELHKQGVDEIGVVIWTTTPWTIPLNYGVVVNPQGSYVIVRHENRAYIVGKEVVDRVTSALSLHQEIVGELSSQDLQAMKAQHPLIPSRHVPIIADESISLTDGTALMHLAPGCGPEDYLIAVKNHIEVLSPLSADGKYTQGIEPAELEGMSIVDGQIWVIKQLASHGFLLKALTSSIRHSYPHCWRCHNGLMYRATKQWFCLLHKNDLIGRSLKAIESMSFVPENGKVRLSSTIANRTEWCLSRQRKWGVPIPALLCTSCEEPYITFEFAQKVAAEVQKEGTEWWDRTSLEDMKQNRIIPATLSCSCGNKTFEKEKDILDVWFDSGVMHYAVPAEDARIPSTADIYLEGTDQHRAWFQSSLLCSMILQDHAPMKEIITHGFVVDGAGYKMSKSVGNVISPLDVIKKLSADSVRLWVASIDYTTDMAISDDLLKKVSDSYRRIRNTIRFLLGNLYDFDYKRDRVCKSDLSALDQYALIMLHETVESIKKGYENYDIALVFRTIMNFCSTFLSSFYLDIIKDRLYVEAAQSSSRRAAQTTCYYILDALVKSLAPILSFLSEEAFDHYKHDKTDSIHCHRFPRAGDELYELIATFECNREAWDVVLKMRTAILKALEEKRAQGVIGHSLDAAVLISFDPKKRNHYCTLLETIEAVSGNTLVERFFKDICIVSSVVEGTHSSSSALDETDLLGIGITVDHARGTKCARCWQWSEQCTKAELCPRCARIIPSENV